MKMKWPVLLISLLMVFSTVAEQTSDRDIRLLNNRFRIDPTIAQVAFIIYREKASKPVVLVRPDGTKLYAWRHPENVSWHKGPDMDIISITNPMPGPWQAIGKVSSQNKIQILSELTMTVDTFPSSLYEGEIVKFTAQLMQEGEPLLLRDFLDQVELRVTFTEYLENEENTPINLRPQEKELGIFVDNATGLDERPGDGIFTVELPINVPPGKYRVRVTSSNGVFFRSLEQQVLVYPTPLMVTFNQSRKKALPHRLLLESDPSSVESGSIAVHAEFINPVGKKSFYEGAVDGDSTALNVDVDNFDEPGRHKWSARLFGTDKLTGRPLVFTLPEQTFAVADFAAIELATLEREAREEKRKQIEDEKMAEAQRNQDRKMAVVTIIGGNLFLLVVAVLLWFLIRKIRAKKAMELSADELDTPPPEEAKKS